MPVSFGRRSFSSWDSTCELSAHPWAGPGPPFSRRDLRALVRGSWQAWRSPSCIGAPACRSLNCTSEKVSSAARHARAAWERERKDGPGASQRERQPRFSRSSGCFQLPRNKSSSNSIRFGKCANATSWALWSPTWLLGEASVEAPAALPAAPSPPSSPTQSSSRGRPSWVLQPEIASCPPSFLSPHSTAPTGWHGTLRPLPFSTGKKPACHLCQKPRSSQSLGTLTQL